MRRILFTGGGTAGHVTPNVALIERFRDEGWDAIYIGSADGIERSIVADTGIPFYAVATGKLRRYFSWRNFTDPFRIAFGLLQAVWLCLRLSPDVVFSKGGFVAVPVVVAAWLCRIPVIAHESDTTPGLATRLSVPFARQICVNFESTLACLPAGKGIVTGSPVRRALLEGNAERGRAALGLSDDKPVLLVVGGSLGARAINDAVRGALEDLCKTFEVVHIVGSGNMDDDADRPGYYQHEFIRDAFGDVLAAADLAISRAGANAIYELLVTRTPHVLVPLPRAASRGDQIENAEAFRALGMSRLVYQEDLSPETLLVAVQEAWAGREALHDALGGFDVPDTVDMIYALVERHLKH